MGGFEIMAAEKYRNNTLFASLQYKSTLLLLSVRSLKRYLHAKKIKFPSCTTANQMGQWCRRLKHRFRKARFGRR
ncbi:hypothetical protein QW180_09890 [Vibrio sinaloensis]|nr:hypothetical protein [Vibrio sinaloensis]